MYVTIIIYIWKEITVALDKTKQVPLPEKIVKHPHKKATYIYYITRTYRNEKGQPTNDRVSIGRLDADTGMLIPNRNYYEIYLNEEPPKQLEIAAIRSCGLTYLVDGILNELGLTDIVRRKFPELADKIIALAEYMLCEGNVMYHYEDWCNEVYPHENMILSSGEISRICSSYAKNLMFPTASRRC